MSDKEDIEKALDDSDAVYKKWRGCGRKKGYTTESGANKFNRSHHNGLYQAYECAYCFMWHLAKSGKIKTGDRV